MSRTPPIPLDTPFCQEAHGVTVRVSPCFLDEESDPQRQRFVWAYTVEIENGRPLPVTLRERHWEIIDARGGRQIVNGRGVIGLEPEIAPGDAFRYTSGAPLSAPSGLMRGFYDFETENGPIRVPIPAFSLDSPHEMAQPC